MSNINFKELREKITPEQIKDILQKNYGVSPASENDKSIIFPTVCHNISGGSNKLYYYKDTKLFKCYTHCEGTFDIFNLIQKIEKLRNKEISIFDAIKKCNLQIDFLNKEDDVINYDNDINFLYNLLKTKNKLIKIPALDSSILNRYVFNTDILNMWVKEGISLDTMKKFHILYDPIENCIIIPNYDDLNNLIGIRGRFLSPDAEAKYKPITFQNKILSYPTSLALYGLNITKNRLEKNKYCIIFESEKSVMMMETYYKEQNCSVATLGKNISFQQIQLLLKYGVKDIIIAYDADYRNYKELEFKKQEYFKIGNILKTYFNVSIIFDFSFNKLKYKDSPIDRGKEIFEDLIQNNRVKI